MFPLQSCPTAALYRPSHNQTFLKTVNGKNNIQITNTNQQALKLYMNKISNISQTITNLYNVYIANNYLVCMSVHIFFMSRPIFVHYKTTHINIYKVNGFIITKSKMYQSIHYKLFMLTNTTYQSTLAQPMYQNNL